jgi:beta-lactamase superfamily II metal-dependent hydrolase
MVDELNITFLNVEHGDSIVISSKKEGNTFWGLIDCNKISRNKKLINPALIYLKNKGVNELSFLALTHMHSDHYYGLDEIIAYFKINEVYLPPNFGLSFQQFKNKKYDSFLKKIKDINCNTNDNIRLKLVSLFKFLFNLKNHKNCQILQGLENRIKPKGFDDNLFLASILPPAKYNNDLLEQPIEFNDSNTNKTSISFEIRFADQIIILGGDTPRSNWLYHRKIHNKRENNLNANFYKVSHHGSKYDNDDSVLNYVFGNSIKDCKAHSYAIISSDGISHPDLEVLDLFSTQSIKPFCTNLSKNCSKVQGFNFEAAGSIPGGFLEQLSCFKTFVTPIACQGNIYLKITKKNVQINSENNLICPYMFNSAQQHSDNTRA